MWYSVCMETKRTAPHKILHSGNYYRHVGWVNGCAHYEGTLGAGPLFVPGDHIDTGNGTVRNVTVVSW